MDKDILTKKKLTEPKKEEKKINRLMQRRTEKLAFLQRFHKTARVA